jgi:hypothetical protein
MISGCSGFGIFWFSVLSMKIRMSACLIATGLIGAAPFCLGRGHSGDHDSGQSHHENKQWHGDHYFDPFWSPWYPGAGSYGAAYPYSYAPSSEQKATAQTCVDDYFTAVRKGRRHAATHRYLAVQTLRPTKKQREDYLEKKTEAVATAKAKGVPMSAHWVEPTQLRCLMVFDTQSKQYVGSGCYVIGSLPAINEVVKFETFPAEFVGPTTVE